MGQILGNELPATVVSYIRGGRIVIVSTVNADGTPNAAPFAWVVAKDKTALRLAISHGVATLENIKRTGVACLSVSSPDIQVTIKGRARVIRDRIDAAIPASVVEVTVEEVKNNSLIGGEQTEIEVTRWPERRRLVSDVTIVNALLAD